jgi:ornithine carbamoyltransferase
MIRHFLDLADWSSPDIRDLLDRAVELKAEWRSGGNPPLLRGKTLAMVFQKPSLRTRVSFEVGMQQLGGTAIMLGPNEIGLGKRESIPDVARTLAAYTQIIMARVFDHQHVIELARWAGIPVINGLTDDFHPCQALADALTIREALGGLEGVTVAFVGDGNNVAASLAQVIAHTGGHFRIATPPGYELPAPVVEGAARIAAANGGSIQTMTDPFEAVNGADVVYTDTWVSMGQEAETEARLPVFQGYQVNAALLAAARPGARVMHCLPAHRGYEITDEVADGPASIIFQQAENRLHAQKAILTTLLIDSHVTADSIAQPR